MNRKIIDAHVHITPPGLSGYTDPYVGTTYYPYGKMTFYNGSPCQKMPVLLKDSCFDADMLIALMDSYGVERSVIMQSGSPSFMEVTMQAVKKYPARLAGAVVPDFKSETNLKDLAGYANAGLRCVKFLFADDMGLMCPMRFPDFRFDSPEVFAYLEAAEDYGMTIAIDLYGVDTCGYQINAFEQAVHRFEKMNFVFCHLGFPPVKKRQEGSEARWQRVLGLAEHRNVFFDLAALPEIVSVQEYPYPEVAPLVRRTADQIGTDRLIWGSDLPQTLTDTTYRQMLNIYEKSDLFSEEEKDRIFYLNAKRVYFGDL